MNDLWLNERKNDLIYIENLMYELTSMPIEGIDVDYIQILREIQTSLLVLVEKTFKRFLQNKPITFGESENLKNIIDIVSVNALLSPKDIKTLHKLQRNIYVTLENTMVYSTDEEIDWLFKFITQFLHDHFGLSAEINKKGID